MLVTDLMVVGVRDGGGIYPGPWFVKFYKGGQIVWPSEVESEAIYAEGVDGVSEIADLVWEFKVVKSGLNVDADTVEIEVHGLDRAGGIRVIGPTASPTFTIGTGDRKEFFGLPATPPEPIQLIKKSSGNLWPWVIGGTVTGLLIAITRKRRR